MDNNNFKIDYQQRNDETNKNLKRAERTPGIWKYERHEIGRYFGNIISELGKGSNGIMNIRTIDIILENNGKEEAEVNAAFIVTACNNYDSLLNALKEVVAAFPVGQYNIKKDFSKLVTLAAVSKAIYNAEQTAAL